MKIERITFGKTIAMPGYNNDKPEIEATLEDGDTLEAVLSALNKRLNDWHKAEYPGLYQESKTKVGEWEAATPPPENWQIQIDSPADTLTAIKASQTLEELKSYKLLVNGDSDLYNAYCERLKYLSA